MRKKVLSIVLLASMILSLAACSKTNEEVEASDGPSRIQHEQATEEDTQETSGEVTQESSEDTQESNEDTQESSGEDTEISSGTTKISGGNNMEKSIQVMDQIYNENKKNTMFSPLSLNMALGLLTEGAEESTASKQALDSYLGSDFSKFAEDYIKDKVSKFNSEESMNGYNTVFELANSIWFADRLTISNDYKQAVVQKYSAEIDNLSTGDAEGSAQKVNSWCNNKTHGMIPSIVSPEQIEMLTSAILVNSVYLETPWFEEWHKMDETTTFTNVDGSTVDLNMLSNYSGTYYENDKTRAFGYYYMNGMEFVGILPNEDGDFNLSDLDIQGLIREPEHGNISVHMIMPELNFETEANLTAILRNSELAPIFEDSADFAGMNNEGEPTKVSAIIQKTKLELDKDGTRASAVTSLMMETCGLPFEEEEPRLEEIIMDRPYAFLIYDRENDQIVFVGKVVSLEA